MPGLKCFVFSGKKWKSLTPSERAPCVQEAEKLRLKHMQVSQENHFQNSIYSKLPPYLVDGGMEETNVCFCQFL